jgi:hypothetical protein
MRPTAAAATYGEGMPQQLTPVQLVTVGTEARTARGFIQHGVLALAALDGANDFRQLPMQLLSIGLERFFKTTIALAELEQSGALPSDLKKHKHDVQTLPTRLVSAVRQDRSYCSTFAADLSFLETDRELDRLLRALTVYVTRIAENVGRRSPKMSVAPGAMGGLGRW